MTSTNTILGYRNVHYWVDKILGKPKVCSECKLDDPKRLYQWANISKEYKKEINDWRRLCVPCHKALDGFGTLLYRNFCRRNHKLTIDKLYLAKGRYDVVACKDCRLQANRKYRGKMRNNK